MLRSMYSAISGLKNFQNDLDVIGNNIANVSTYGFKKGRTTFKDLVSQQISGATAPQAGSRGGVNPMQVGLGSAMGAVDTVDTQGSIQNTGRSLDAAISGDGYFVVNDGKTNYFTRAGNFYLDSKGTLVNSDGMNVSGIDASGKPVNSLVISKDHDNAGTFGTDASGNPITLDSFSIGTDGGITGTLSNGSVRNLGTIQLATFNNPGGLEKKGNDLFVNTSNSGSPSLTTAGKGAGSLVAGALEMSNVDMAEEFTSMIEAQRGFEANAKVITTADQILQTLVNLKR